MSNITSWLPAALFSSPLGFNMQGPEGEIVPGAVYECEHARAEVFCNCGFSSYTERQDAQEEAFTMPLVEFSHPREAISTDGTFIHASMREIVAIHVSSACYECDAHVDTFTKIDRPDAFDGDAMIETSCEAHAGPDGLISHDDLELAFNAPVKWRNYGEMAEFLVEQEAASILEEADRALFAEKMSFMLADADSRALWIDAIRRDGINAQIHTLTVFQEVSLDALKVHSHAVKEILDIFEPAMIQTLHMLPSGVSKNLDYVVSLLR